MSTTYILEKDSANAAASDLTGSSLRKRYFSKLLANLVGIATGAVVQAIVPRGLGPVSYGVYHFLTSYFEKLFGFLEMGTSACFFTKLSKHPEDLGIVSFYLRYLVLICAGVVAFVFVAQIAGGQGTLWPGQTMKYVYMALAWVGLTWFNDMLTKMSDAFGLTVNTERMRVVQKFLGLALIALLYFSGTLQLTNFFIYHYSIMLFLAGSFIWVLHGSGVSLKGQVRLSKGDYKKYIGEFYLYSHPLVVLGVFGMVAGIFDRWLLQVCGGGVEQGFYSLSFMIGGLCIVFTRSMTPLIMREMSIAHHNRDIKKMAKLFRRYAPLLYAIAAYMSCYVAVNASKVVYLFGGGKFAGAVVPVSIMAFYPLHQTYGQLTASVFYAAGDTRPYRNINIVFMIIGLLVTYFMIAPRSWYGLDAGANGLAVKMVLINIFCVNIQLLVNARYLEIHFWKYLLHQIACVACFLIIALVVASAMNHVLGSSANLIGYLILSGIAYSAATAGISYAYPSLLGIKRSDIHSFYREALAKIGR